MFVECLECTRDPDALARFSRFSVFVLTLVLGERVAKLWVQDLVVSTKVMVLEDAGRVGHQANGGPRQPRPNSVAAQCGAGMFFQFGVSAPRVLMETWSLTELFGFLQPNIFQA